MVPISHVCTVENRLLRVAWVLLLASLRNTHGASSNLKDLKAIKLYKPVDQDEDEDLVWKMEKLFSKDVRPFSPSIL
ncbi:hypothetical protein B0J17DRAFT_723247 [Rhizoctonia solani]|nr:hypothetical protein B0J17DRAFT_723247 [Rhizoctonia solani]